MEHLVPALLVLACPLGMGLMLRLRMRGNTNRGAPPGSHAPQSPAENAPAPVGRPGGLCPNWKVVAGLAAAGLGAWAVAPDLAGAILPLLLVACPGSYIGSVPRWW